MLKSFNNKLSLSIGLSFYFFKVGISLNIVFYCWISFLGTLRGQEKEQYVLKLFNSGSVSPQFLKLESKLMSDCHLKLNEYFKVPVPIKTNNKANKKDGDDYDGYIGSCDISLHKNAVFEGCTKQELINKGLIHETTTGQSTCGHLTRLVRFIEGTVPKDIKDDNLIQSWAKNTARLGNFFQVFFFFFLILDLFFCLRFKQNMSR